MSSGGCTTWGCWWFLRHRTPFFVIAALNAMRPPHQRKSERKGSYSFPRSARIAARLFYQLIVGRRSSQQRASVKSDIRTLAIRRQWIVVDSLRDVLRLHNGVRMQPHMAP